MTASMKISELSSEASEDPTMIYDDAWRSEMATALAMLRDCNNRVRQLDPPPAYEASHRHLLDAADHFDATVTYMIDGIDEMDGDLIAKAGKHMSEGADCVVLATDALQPGNTPVPTESADPARVPMVTVEETGETVTDNHELPECFKAVFDWHVDPGAYGSASLILKLHNVAKEEPVTLVNEFGENPEGLDGRALQPLIGGQYFFSSENTDEPWRVAVICEDNAAPVASGELDVEGRGNTVSDNYELPACSKSVFSYSVEPDDLGSASIIIYLCNADQRVCATIANEFEMDLTDPMEGKAIESLRGGHYFFATENASGNDWRISWECQD